MNSLEAHTIQRELIRHKRECVQLRIHSKHKVDFASEQDVLLSRLMTKFGPPIARLPT